MNFISKLWSHPASALITVVILVFVTKSVVGFFRGREKNDDKRANKISPGSFACFFSGVLFVNGLAHFSHGISGEHFPAPYGYLLGRGFPEYLTNVLWGFLNIVLGYELFVKGGVRHSKLRKIAFFSGVLAMGIFLSFVFSHSGRSVATGNTPLSVGHLAQHKLTFSR